MTNNQHLHALKAQYKLTTANVCNIMGVSVSTVDKWLLRDSSPHQVNMPDNQLKLLKLLLKVEK
jgi:DNA-binding transcriptional regulator YiaG